MTMAAAGLALLSALFYVGATVIMKLWGPTAFAIALPAAGLTLLVAAAVEIEALRHGHMGRVFVIIIGFEIIVTMVCAVILIGEAVTLRDAFGVSLLIAGVIVMSAGHDTTKPAEMRLAKAAEEMRDGAASKADRLDMRILIADIAPEFEEPVETYRGGR